MERVREDYIILPDVTISGGTFKLHIIKPTYNPAHGDGLKDILLGHGDTDMGKYHTIEKDFGEMHSVIGQMNCRVFSMYIDDQYPISNNNHVSMTELGSGWSIHVKYLYQEYHFYIISRGHPWLTRIWDVVAEGHTALFNPLFGEKGIIWKHKKLFE